MSAIDPAGSENSADLQPKASQAAPKRPGPTLVGAVHQARIENAERSQVISEIRGAEIARLQMMQDSLQPILDEVPKNIDIFDCALAEGDHPRLFVDMLAFIEMTRDSRTYRFVQDTRYGRLILAESERFDTIVTAARHYIARRLVERQSALASDQTIEQAARRLQAPLSAPDAIATKPPMRSHWLGNLLKFIIEFIGVFVLTALLLLGAISVYGPARGWVLAHMPQASPHVFAPKSP